MTVVETIIRGVQNLPLREQVSVARYVHSLDANARQVRLEVLQNTHGALDERDGLAFEQAMESARVLEAHG